MLFVETFGNKVILVLTRGLARVGQRQPGYTRLNRIRCQDEAYPVTYNKNSLAPRVRAAELYYKELSRCRPNSVEALVPRLTRLVLEVYSSPLGMR